MAAISGTDLALTTARVGAARVGSFRVGFIPCATTGPGSPWFGEYIWDELKPPTTQWTLLTEDCVCGQHPEASFSNVLCNAVGPVAFTDTSTPTGEITSWYWDFGDGGTSTDQNPTHTYAAGFFTVTLYVSGDKGTGSATGYVSVMSALVATAVPNPTSVGQDVTFTPTFTGGLAPYTYKWAFEVDTLWDDLVHAWSLDEPSGTRFDCLGAKNLTEYGTVGTAAGAYGDASDFTSGFVWRASGPTRTADFTLSLWFKIPAHPTGLTGLLYMTNGGFSIVTIMMLTHLFWAGESGWTTPAAIQSAGAIDDGNWHHVVVWVDTAVDMKLHASIDGAATIDSTMDLGGVFNTSPNDLSIGVGNGVGVGTPTGLFIQRVALFNQGLTAGQRAALYTGQFYGSGMEEPSYAYPTAGAKVASLTVTSATGCTITDTVDVTVNPTSTVEGTITIDGHPWAGDVSMTVDAVPWPGGVATTDVNGFYQFLLVPAGAIEVTCALGSNAGVTVPPATLVLDIVSVS